MAYTNTKPASLEALEDIVEKSAKTFATKTEMKSVSDKLDGLVASGGEANVIDEIDVNGVKVEPDGKKVNITVPKNTSELVNNSDFQTGTQVSGAVSEAVNAAVTKLNGEGDGSIKEKIDAALNKFATDVTENDVVDTYKELVDYAAEHKGEAAAMAGDIQSLKTKTQNMADGATKVEKSNTNGNIKINGVEQIVYTPPENMLTGEWATEEEVQAMLTRVLGE